MSEPAEMNEEPNNYEDVTSLSLEKDLEINLMKNLEQLEQGLSSPQSQVPFESGEVRSIIDILAKDKDGKIVVIELKAGIATEKVCGQILKYISLVKNQIKIPYSLRPQAHDIIRTWAFYTITKSYLHEKFARRINSLNQATP